MVDRGACTILFATGTYIDTGCIAVIHTDAVITLAGATGQCDGMLVGETGTGNLVNPIGSSTQITGRIVGNTVFAELFGSQLVEFMQRNTGGQHTIIGSMEFTVA